MNALRFGIAGARPERVSVWGRMAIQALQASGAELVAWVEGAEEPALPWNLHRPGPIPGAAAVPRRLDSDVDFLLLLGEGSPAHELMERPRYGVWQYAAPTPAPLAFWDVYDGLYHTEIRLDRLTADPLHRIPVDRRWVKVDRCSYARTLAAVIHEMAEMPAYAARANLAAPMPAAGFPPARVQQPSRLDLLCLGAKLLLRSTGEQWRGLFFSEAWQIGMMEDFISHFMEGDAPSPVRWLPPPGGTRYLADPFIATAGEGWLMTAEEFDYATDRGTIVQEFSADGDFTGRMQGAQLGDPAESIHRSYPFLLSHDGALYCVPESHGKNGAWAWRWDESSHQWRNPREIISGVACIDPTPFFFENRWWLFFTDKADGVDCKLRVCFSDSPFGPWQPHARNPVKTDVRSSRPGGSPFIRRGRLYRPAQDCSKHYGWRLVINQITRLTPDEFEEGVVRVLDCSLLGTSGIHTLSAAGSKTVIDGRRWRFTPTLMPGRLVHKLKKLFSAESKLYLSL